MIVEKIKECEGEGEGSCLATWAPFTCTVPSHPVADSPPLLLTALSLASPIIGFLHFLLSGHIQCIKLVNLKL